MGQCIQGKASEAEAQNEKTDDGSQPNLVREETGLWLRGGGQTTTPTPTEEPPANHHIMPSSNPLAAPASSNRPAGKRPSGSKINSTAFVSVVPLTAPRRTSEMNEVQSTQCDGNATTWLSEMAQPLGIAPKRVSLPQESEGERWNYPTGSLLSISSERGEETADQSETSKKHHFFESKNGGLGD